MRIPLLIPWKRFAMEWLGVRWHMLWLFVERDRREERGTNVPLSLRVRLVWWTI